MARSGQRKPKKESRMPSRTKSGTTSRTKSRTKLCAALLVAFGAGLQTASAQDAGQPPAQPPAPQPQTQPQAQAETQRVEVTGSSIKRIAAETALPVQVFTAEDIQKTGITNVADLIQNLPAMQGFTQSSQSVNGLGAGKSTASIHDIGEKYTLVLLNGRRLAPLNSGTTVNLNSLPLAAIERVEVLTDGASALYGADAVAGVVNFILRKDTTEGELEVNGDVPQHPGGGQYTMSLTKGFGDLDRQGFNLLFSASFDKQLSLKASQRDFSRSGFLPFDYYNGHYITELASVNAVGANVFLNSPGPNYPKDPGDINGSDSAGGGFFNPYLAKNGHCASGQNPTGAGCLFDYPSTVDSIPESTRASVWMSGRAKLEEQLSLFTEVMFSHFYTDPRYAPPAQPLQVTQALYDKDVAPYVTQVTGLQPQDIIPPSDPLGNGPQMTLRLYDAGNRQDRYQTDSLHAVIGAEGTLSNWDFTTYYTHSQNKFYDKALSGYMSKNFLYDRIADGSFDPFMAAAGESVAVLAPGVLHSTMDQSKSAIDLLSLRGSRSLGHLSGGDIAIGTGAEFMRQSYSDSPSAIQMGKNPLQPDFTDAIVGGAGGSMPFDSKRNSWGVYGELELPVVKEFDLTASARYDNIAAVDNSLGFNDQKEPIGSVTQGKSQSATTFKLTGRLQPTREFLMRGSFGTGFRAPSLQDISSPLQSGGSTGTQDCPVGLADSLRSLCKTFPYEYNSANEGNPATGDGALKPERSTQWTLGFRVEPGPAFSFGADLWDVRIHDTIGTIPEDTAFQDAVTYANLFVSAPDPISGAPTLTFVQLPQNLGTRHFQGIDLDASGRMATPIGRLTTQGRMTYMLEANYQFVPGGPQLTSMDQIGPDGQVTFRWVAALSASLETGAFTNTLNGNFRPGYKDAPQLGEIAYRNADGSIGNDVTDPNDPVFSRHVGSWNTFDWIGRWDADKALALSLGVRNIFDKKPPFTAQDEVQTGNARGFDGRYTDPVGRSLYLALNYKF
jgi:iron complex outermembrane receptor protein